MRWSSSRRRRVSRCGPVIIALHVVTPEVKYYEDMIVSMCLKKILHLTGGNTNLAKAAINLRRGYFGVALTKAHLDQMIEHLVDWMLLQFADSNSPHYKPAYAAEMGEDVAPGDDDDADPDDDGQGGKKKKRKKGEPKKSANKKGTGAGGAKKKKKKKGDDGEGDESEEEEFESEDSGKSG